MNIEKLHRDTADAMKAMEKLYRDTADAMKAIKALNEGETIDVETSDDGETWRGGTYVGVKVFAFRFYRLPKPKPVLWMETGWVKNKYGGFLIIDHICGGEYWVNFNYYTHKEMLEHFTPCTLAEVKQAEIDMRGEG